VLHRARLTGEQQRSGWLILSAPARISSPKRIGRVAVVRDNAAVGDEVVVSDDSASDGDGPVRVFMSYRRADDHHFIGRLHDRLCAAFGDDMVFRDIDSIPAGTNFRSVILRTLNEVDAVVAVIGPRWVRQAGDETSDYVYLELAEALQQGKHVIPVLMEQTPMPAQDALPVDLRSLTEINAISVHGDPAFRRDSGRLIDVIRDVVARDRARVTEERRAAEALARRAEEERQERERFADELRAEERAARMRLAELEEAAARRQIELENARLADIAERLRLAEAREMTTSPDQEDQTDQTDQPALVEQTEQVEQTAIVEPPPPAAVVESQTVTASARPRADPPTSSRPVAEQRVLQALIVAATVFGVIALYQNRSEATPFSELSSDWKIDACVWIFALAVAVPLLLSHRPVEQRFVLIGVAASVFFFHFLQASALVRYGTTGYDEGSWIVLKAIQTVCLMGAIWIVRQRAAEPLPSSMRLRVLLVAMAATCGALVVIAMSDQFTEAGHLVHDGFLKDRTPFSVWLIFLVLGPVALTVGLAMRRSYGARVALATIATLAIVSYVGEALVADQVFDVDGSLWAWTAAAHVPLAAIAWWTVVVAARRYEAAGSLDAA
jgi:hypothetical protein